MAGGESIDSKRFEVRRRIGSGAFGVVYEAFDPVRNQLVALKALRHVTPDALYRFKREFRSLTEIAHRNLVHFYELIAEGEQWLVSMELIRGTSFIEHVRDDARADVGRLRVALAQLASGLIALHAAGKLHRDIKPSNVLVADDRRVVLLDFGLVTDTDARASDETTGTSGTPAYMSPEQGAGEPLTPASDWYSAGVMLYNALTGDVPFRGTYVEVINQKRAGDVPPPSTIVPGIPEDIDALCADLLRLDPQQRPSGEEILRRLGPSPLRIDIARTRTPFIGRDRELQALRETFEASVAGAQTTVCVTGPSGIGKTALIRAFLERLRDEVPDLLVLAGRCYQRESMPYKGVDSLVDALHRYLSRLMPQELEVLLPRDIGAAEQLFPVLSDVADVVRSRLRTSASIVADGARAHAALRELLLRLTDRMPLVLVIDDLQWGGTDGAELMKEILRAPDAPALLFIAAYRSDEPNASRFIDAFRSTPLQEIALAELTIEESRRLAESLGCSPEAASSIADESRGHPSLIEELARACTLAGDAASIGAVLQLRLRRLGSAAARMLQYIAVNGRPITQPVLRLAFPGEEFDDVLATLVAQHLVRTRETASGDAVEPYHARIADAAIASLSDDELRSVHAVLALALEASPGNDASLLAEHFRAAGMHERAAKYI